MQIKREILMTKKKVTVGQDICSDYPFFTVVMYETFIQICVKFRALVFNTWTIYLGYEAVIPGYKSQGSIGILQRYLRVCHVSGLIIQVIKTSWIAAKVYTKSKFSSFSMGSHILVVLLTKYFFHMISLTLNIGLGHIQ